MLFRLKERDQLFFLLLATALAACVLNDISAGIWRLHGGELFPWRHFPGIWLYAQPVLLLEWGLTLLSAACLLRADWRRAGVWLGAFVVFVSLLERFSNQRSLLFIILFFLAASPKASLQAAFPAIRFQLLIVYLFSVVNKIDCAFWTGETLVQLGGVAHGAILPHAFVHVLLSKPLAQPLSILVLAVEFVIPLFLLKLPRTGFLLAGLLHLGLSLSLPGLWPFSIAMMAMASLFLRAGKA